jgi:PIN domain nuclease of toxin-antitoxin system
VKAFLDTHAAVALYQGDRELFGRSAASLAERSALFISPVVRLELALLKEIGRLRVEAEEIVRGLIEDWGVAVAGDPLEAVVLYAVPLAWTRDPFDRLLVATARLHRAPLITKDPTIHEHYAEAVW